MRATIAQQITSTGLNYVEEPIVVTVVDMLDDCLSTKFMAMTIPDVSTKVSQ
ncbi:MAG: hypothetical protein ACK521_00825 [bacterium]